jgi:NADP-dependent 3-hydroxy acid dehydrogenase YdfG
MTSRSEHGLQHVLVVGAGSGLSASIARRFAAEGLAVSLAARNTEKLAGLADEVGAEVYTCDASQTDQVDVLFANLDKAKAGAPDVVVYNPSARVRGSITELNPDDVHHALMVTGFGGFWWRGKRPDACRRQAVASSSSPAHRRP